ncbi:hypothetical protein WJX81_006676 [Elliptochloris bilobata]|uniref:Glycosyl transferase CAP10 domain-containing protein n=1 Tax=Elliptochloris bilobata TaxID=381761 RepID=A0AAW1S5B4_9CHLO
MAGDEECGRPKRRRAASRNTVPSAVHYLGYVEEDETPEAIMKKFEELEKVMAAAGAANEAQREARGAAECGQDAADLECTGDQAEDGLTEEQLMEVFKQTSIFNVRSAMAGNEALLGPEVDASEEDRFWEEGGLSDDEDLWGEVQDFWSDDEGAGEPGKRRRAARGTPRPLRAGGPAKPRHHIVTHYNTVTQALIRRKVKAVDKNALVHIKVPLPLPLSWGRTVAPYAPPSERVLSAPAAACGDENVDANADPVARAAQTEAVGIVADDVVKADWSSLKTRFQAVLVNGGWEVDGGDAAARLAKVPLPRLVPVGFVFVWAQKHHVAALVRQLYRWGFCYIENLTWVQMAANNTVLTLPAPYAQRSHLTLLIFRKDGEGKDIELRHQRNPDVVFDCLRAGCGSAFDAPEEALVAIETLLPTGKGKFLELWASPKARRPGWTHVAAGIGMQDANNTGRWQAAGQRSLRRSSYKRAGSAPAYTSAQDFYIYNRPAPWGFEAWLNYARENRCVLEAYEQIERDLAPFRGTYAGDAYLAMLAPIASRLPDMDFVVNLNDEPRVLPGGNLEDILQSPCVNASAALKRYAPLHGFFTAGWQALVDELLPVFSQSKVDCFADITVPSWTNYDVTNDEADAPDTAPWDARAPLLFFRGSSTGGFVSDTTNFSSMHRQRLVGLAANDSRMDVSFVEYVQCSHAACAAMEKRYGRAERAPEEAAWANKFVMILDGNTFSSRLMRTLRSGSLIFRAGLFSEWFDERLEPFLHYLPCLL